MRSTKINVKDRSLEDRIKLHNHLTALGEPIYEDTELHKSKNYDCFAFIWSSIDPFFWIGHSTTSSDAISIEEFIKKFPVKHQYKPGDTVKIRNDLKQGYVYTVYVNDEMAKLAGKLVNITRDSGRKIGKDSKTIWKIRQNSFDWTEELFEQISTTDTPEKEQEMDIKVGDVYKNSSGNLNTITRVIDKNWIYYTTSTGREYHISLDLIERNWKKLLYSVETTQQTTVLKYLDRIIKTGDYVERTKHYDTRMSEGSIWKVITGGRASITVTDGRGTWGADNFKVINPEHPSHPDYRASTPTPAKTLTGFKPGDRVKVRSDLLRDNAYKMLSGKKYIDFVNPDMMRLAGKIVTIQRIDTYTNRYYLEEDGSNWVDEMFDGLESEQTPIPQTPIAPPVKYPIGFEFELHINPTQTLRVVETKISKSGDFIYNLQYVSNGDHTGFVSESFITNQIDLAKTKAAMKVFDTSILSTTPVTEAPSIDTFVSSAATVIRSKKTIGTPIGGTNQPILKSEKKSMAKAIKDTALITLDQNKQAAIIAGKMEAGRILNKQVLKQIKPHIPMFVRGYLDTPLAPVIVANLVAAVGNHTQNRRVQQVSELMLLAAADATVQSFNLDKIIDDVLAGVKLPAGILDTDEE